MGGIQSGTLQERRAIPGGQLSKLTQGPRSAVLHTKLLLSSKARTPRCRKDRQTQSNPDTCKVGKAPYRHERTNIAKHKKNPATLRGLFTIRTATTRVQQKHMNGNIPSGASRTPPEGIKGCRTPSTESDDNSSGNPLRREGLIRSKAKTPTAVWRSIRLPHRLWTVPARSPYTPSGVPSRRQTGPPAKQEPHLQT